MRYLFLIIILYLCCKFVTLGQEGNSEFEKKPYWVENFDKKGGLDDKLWGSKKEKSGSQIGLAHVCTPVTPISLMPSSA